MKTLKNGNNIVAFGPQPGQTDESFSGLGFAAGAAAGIAATGFIPTKSGRMWDHYISAIRSAETAFPGAVMRTFRVSETLSPLETWKRVSISPDDMYARGVYGDYLRKILGETSEGVDVVRSGAVFGQVRGTDNRVLGYALNVASGTQRGEAIADYFARLSGIKVPEGLSMAEGALYAEWQAGYQKTGMSFEDWKKLPDNRIRQPRLALMTGLRDEINVFGKRFQLSERMSHRLAKAELATKFIRAKTATSVGRLNNLLQKPFEVPVLGEALEKIPFVRSMAIEQGSATQMWGRYVKKGVQAGMIWKGLEYYDYLRSQEQPWAVAAGTFGGAALGGYLFKRQIEPFGKKGAIAGAALGLYTSLSPRFDEGLFHGLATFVTDANLLRARFSDTVGLTDQLQSQNLITPGLITPGAAVAAAGTGALFAGLASYGGMMVEAAKVKAQKQLPMHEIVGQLRIERAEDFAQKWAGGIGKTLSKIPGVGKQLGTLKSPMVAGALAGFAAWSAVSTAASLLSGNPLAAIPGLNLLGSDETEEQLQKWYSGEEEVPIRKGRWWEFGRSTSYGGGRIQYYRQHNMARLKSRAYQKGLWGSEEERWAHDPVLHPLKALFGSDEWKYAYEIKHQEDRPAPLTGTYFEDVPFIGPLLAASLGKMLKPRKFVRADEWMLGEGKFVHHPGRPESEPAYELGGLAPGAPVDPDSPGQLFNELMYRRREAIGLVGFAEGAIQKAITGREEVFANQQTLATMGRETGSEYWLWKHLNVGGALGTSELIRRFIPRRRSYLEGYNPLKADLPSWMPEDYFMDYEHGNPWDKIPEAELRLPGPGLAALYPELEGVDPEDYSLAWKAKILGDVAMWSPEYKAAMKAAWAQKSEMSEAHQRMLEVTREQVKAKKTRREFDDYRFREEELERMSVTVKEVLDPRTILTEEFGGMQVTLQGVGAVNNMTEAMEAAREALEGREIDIYTPALEGRRYRKTAAGSAMKAVAMVGDQDYGAMMAGEGYVEAKDLKDEFYQLRFSKGQQVAGALGEAYSRAALTPAEMLSPASPMSKFYRHRSALEEYIATEAIGTGSAFWDRPFENFFGPAKEMAEYKMGDEEIPFATQKRRAITEYFDILEYVKQKKLATEAVEEGRFSEAAEFSQQAKKTTFGVNPFRNPSSVMMAMPRRERDFFSEFVEARTEEERQAILDVVPRDLQPLYLSQWVRQETEAIVAKKEAGIATKEDDAALAQMASAVRSEGISHDEYLEDLWKQETGGRVPFAEWLRKKKLQQYFSVRSLPGPDWIGWHPSVDLKDIEVKYVQNEGLDHHEYDLWGDRVRSLARKPYLLDAELALTPSDDLTAALEEETEMIANARSFMGGSSSDIIVSRIGANIGSRFDMDISDNRQNIVIDAYDSLGAKTLRDY